MLQAPTNSPSTARAKVRRVVEKGEGKNNVKYTKAPMKPHDPEGRAQAAMRCLRCAIQLPNAPKDPSQLQKLHLLDPTSDRQLR